MTAKMLIVHPHKCTACRQCEVVCSVKQTGVSSPCLSPIKVLKRENQGLNIPVHCQQCQDAPCKQVCPQEAISYDEKLSRVWINQALCISCQMCIAACPFGALEFNPLKRLVFKCDLCAGKPLCVDFCEVQAITYREDYQINYEQKECAASRLLAAVKQRIPGNKLPVKKED